MYIGSVFIFLMTLFFLSFSELFQITNSNGVIDAKIPFLSTLTFYLFIFADFFISYGFILPQAQKQPLENAYHYYIGLIPALAIVGSCIFGFVSGVLWLSFAGSVNWTLVLPMFVLGFISGIFFYFNLPTLKK